MSSRNSPAHQWEWRRGTILASKSNSISQMRGGGGLVEQKGEGAQRLSPISCSVVNISYVFFWYEWFEQEMVLHLDLELDLDPVECYGSVFSSI